ncbi:hypothetical protein [Sphingorhabdus sp.]|jgi:hypothetical protein|uniref:hypothetical protein n=1 Tax=Sphingorhabdus sp. TaxID=1902408 RepID=UPI0037CC1764
MSLSKKPTTIRELKAALAALRDSDKVTVYEANELRNKLPAISVLVQQGRTVLVI